ncbi:hypothetical protein ACWDUG_33330, partial [Streptomyces cellulosae]
GGCPPVPRQRRLLAAVRLLARLPYGVLAANAVSLLPPWASRALRMPRLPAEGLCVRPLGSAVTAGIRWALAPTRPAA